jgi:hypothetical protein
MRKETPALAPLALVRFLLGGPQVTRLANPPGK